jgi:hypothetical protein
MAELPWTGKYLTVGGRYYVYCRAAGSPIRSSCLQPVMHGTPVDSRTAGPATGTIGAAFNRSIGVDVPEREVEAKR